MIRLATQDDFQAIKKIANQNRAFIGFILRASMNEALNHQALWVAEEAGEVVGFARCHPRLDGWNTLHELAVAPHAQGKGIGKALFACIPQPIRLKTTEDNARAIAFYTRLGMQKSGVENGRKRKLVLFTKGAPHPTVRPRKRRRTSVER